MADVVLKYSASVYKAKITQFDTLDGQLMGHLGTLETLKGQINSFWTNDQATSYIEKIAKAITRVNTAHNEVTNLSRTYQETIDELTRAGQAVDDISANVDKVIDRQIEIAQTVADFIPD